MGARDILRRFEDHDEKTEYRLEKMGDKEVISDTPSDNKTSGTGLKKTGFYVPKDLG